MYPVCKLGMGRGTGASCLSLGLPLGGQQRSNPHQVFIPWGQACLGAATVWESLGSGVLCDSLGSAKLLSHKPDRPAWRPLDHGPRLGTDTTFENYIDCSLLEVVITELVEGH